MLKKVSLSDLNPHIVCFLCGGYFVDPVTLVECLHSFCKSCIVKHVEANKICPICDVQIHKTRPLLSMRSDKALQNIVYKLVPGLYKNEMDRRKKFQEKHEPTKVSKEELEKHFFFQDDKISMSIEYYDPQNPDGSPPEKSNPNRRYLECPGTVKIQHLKKFIVMKYGLNENFVIDIIYSDDLIPEDYTLIDVAYYYSWKKHAPMKFFYRIFKKNRVLLKRRKRKLEAEESPPADASEVGLKMARNEDQNGKPVGSVLNDENLGGRDQSVDIRSCPASTPTTSQNTSAKTSNAVETPKIEDKKDVKKEEPTMKKEEEPVAMEVDRPVEKKIEPGREVKIISLLNPGKTSIVCSSEIGVKPKPETKENDAPPAAVTASQNSVTSATTTNTSTVDHVASDEGSKVETKTSDIKMDDAAASASTVAGSNSTTSTSMSSPGQQKIRKPGTGSQILSVINNLAKKQQTLEAASGNNKDVKVPSVIHGQTTITKRIVENGVNGASSPTGTTPKTLPTSHPIPTGTTITLKQVESGSTSPKASSVPAPTIKPATGTAPSIQTPKPLITTNGASTTMTSSTSMTAAASVQTPVASKPKQVVNDLRQFRKCPTTTAAATTIAATSSTPSTTSASGNSSPALTLSRPPIIPQLTLAGRVKTPGAGTITSGQPHHGSHRLPASTSAGIATSRPLSLSGSAIGRLPPAFPAGMSAADQQKALQLLRMPNSPITASDKVPVTMSTMSNTHLSTPTTTTTPVTAAQLPSNRLQLKVQPSMSSFQAVYQSSLLSHIAAESMWNLSSLAQSTTSGATPNTNGGKGIPGLPKTLNQGIRQIPNPSLLTKQQQTAAEQFMMAMAANFAAAGVRTSPKQ